MTENNECNKTFEQLKIDLMSSNKKACELIPDPRMREERVRKIGQCILDYPPDEINWFIEQFINDPDPSIDSNDPSFEYCKQINSGKDPLVITSVLGHLAWVVQKLAISESYIKNALYFTRKLVDHPNLYVKLQAIIPLIEIAKRRQWLDGWKIRPYEKTYKDFNELVFYFVNFVKNNPNFVAIAKWMIQVLYYYKDLSTEQAEQILDSFKITSESGGLYVYYALYRQSHYEDQDIEFNSTIFEDKLRSIIASNDNNDARLRKNVAWQLWKIQHDDKKQFPKVKEYIDLFLEQPYQRGLNLYIEDLINDRIDDYPMLCTQWFETVLDNISTFSNKEIQEQKGIWIFRTGPILQSIAKNQPDKLEKIISKMQEVEKKGIIAPIPNDLLDKIHNQNPSDNA